MSAVWKRSVAFFGSIMRAEGRNTNGIFREAQMELLLS